MAILVTSPVTGSLKIQNTSASVTAQSMYITNCSTVQVLPNPTIPSVDLENSQSQLIISLPLASITQIAASTQSFGLQWAADSIANLIMK